MEIHGLSKLTLLDYPGHLACTIFTGACSFRCPFCHNASLVLLPDQCPAISEEELFDFLRSRKGKLEGVCITGGEPTLQPDLPEFIKKTKDLGFSVKLDTNGYRPEIVRSLIEERLLDMIAMDIKNAPDLYAKTCGLPKETFDLTKIEESIRLLIRSGLPHEFRTTVTKELHDRDTMLQTGEWLQALSSEAVSSPIVPSPYFLQEFKDSGDLVAGKDIAFHPHTKEAMQEFIAILKPYLPNVKLRGEN